MMTGTASLSTTLNVALYTALPKRTERRTMWRTGNALPFASPNDGAVSPVTRASRQWVGRASRLMTLYPDPVSTTVLCGVSSFAWVPMDPVTT